MHDHHKGTALLAALTLAAALTALPATAEAATPGKVRNVDGTGDHVSACTVTARGTVACWDLAPGQTSPNNSLSIQWVSAAGDTVVCWSRPLHRDPCGAPLDLGYQSGTRAVYVRHL